MGCDGNEDDGQLAVSNAVLLSGTAWEAFRSSWVVDGTRMSTQATVNGAILTSGHNDEGVEGSQGP